MSLENLEVAILSNQNIQEMSKFSPIFVLRNYNDTFLLHLTLLPFQFRIAKKDDMQMANLLIVPQVNMFHLLFSLI